MGDYGEIHWGGSMIEGEVKLQNEKIAQQEHKWTDEQLQAICSRDCSLLVAAAAGAGKTAVLVERIIRKLTDKTAPVDIDRMLIVTFTNAAATEMRERIGEAISKELDRQPESESLRRQSSLLAKASITTIHSFCRDVIKKHIEHIDLDPGFRVADETESTLMRLEAMTELFEDQYEQEKADFNELLECYGGNRNDQPVQDMVMNLYDFIQSSPWPDKWLEEKLDALDVLPGMDFSQTPWGRVLINTIQLELSGLKHMLDQALGMLNPTTGLERYAPVFEEERGEIEKLIQIITQTPHDSCGPTDDSSKVDGCWDVLYEALHAMEFKRLPPAGKNADKEKQASVKEIRDTVKTVINTKLRKKLVNARSEEIIRDLQRLSPVLRCLGRLVRDFSQRYQQKKKKRAILDFNDLEHLCLEVLTEHTETGIVPSQAAQRYQEQFEEIMVDEYQDSNLVQEILIQMISRHKPHRPNVFMVGDVKQSIYRFRQAKPELFLEKYNTFSQDSGSLFRKILLFKNFRSRGEVLDGVNYIFKQIMSEKTGEMDYTDAEALNHGALFPECSQPESIVGGPVEFHLLQTEGTYFSDEEEEPDDGSGDDSKREEEESLDNIQSEARLVALRILELMAPDADGRYFHVFDKKKKEYRKAAFRDIVILLRATKNWSEVFLDELAGMGIPAFADTGTGFFKTIEIQVVLSLLQIIDNPLQDIPLLSVLRSPICAFSTNELAEVRLVQRKVLLYDALKLLAQKHPVSEGPETMRTAAEKAAGFLEKLSRWRELSLHMPTDQLLWFLYQDTGYYGMVGAMPAGEQRQANLRILYDRARQFEETSYKGLFNFIHFIDRLKSSRGDMGSAKILGENDNVVRIMSIHKSKGLEFPVVFLSGCGKRFNLTDMNRSVLLHHQLGFGADVVDYRLRISRPSVLKRAIQEKIRVETLSEEMRILYVAMTRAREKLIITGAVRSIEKKVSRWLQTACVHEDKLPAHAILKGSGYLDWIGPALIRHANDAGEKSRNVLMSCAGIGTEYSGKPMIDPSRWQMRIWSKNDVLAEKISEVHEEKELLDWLDGQLVASEPYEYFTEVERRLGWDYPYTKANTTPAKITVTELKRRFEAELADVTRIPVQIPPLVKKPMFLEVEKGLSAAEKGTVLHFVMQHLDFGNSNLQQQLDAMVKKDLLTEQQAETVRLGKIVRFLETDLGRRMMAAKRIYREVPFNLEIFCHELFLEMIEEEYKDETLLLQGIIDCYFEEPDGLVLLDYKTDYVPQGGIAQIIGKYRVQLDYYTRALENLTRQRVKERYLYLFSVEQLVEM